MKMNFTISFLIIGLLLISAFADEDYNNGYSVMAGYFRKNATAGFQKYAGSILTWRDIDMHGITIGAGKGKYTGRIHYGMTDNGYATDDDMNNRLYAWSNYRVEARNYGLDIHEIYYDSDIIKMRNEYGFSRLALDGYTKTSFEHSADLSDIQFVIYGDPSMATERYVFNTAAWRFGINAYYLDAAAGLGMMYGESDWRSGGETFMEWHTFGLTLSFKIAVLLEFPISNRTTFIASAGYANELLLCDITYEKLNKSAMDPSDHRYDQAESLVGMVMKDAYVSDFTIRIGISHKL
jgi:hypothetical protein